MSEHSPEPWRVAGPCPDGVAILSADGRIVAIAVPPLRGLADDANTRADAARIIACVNALAGVPVAPAPADRRTACVLGTWVTDRPDGGPACEPMSDAEVREAVAGPVLGLLRRVVEADPLNAIGICRHCEAWIGADPADRPHAPDCPYVAARALLEGEEDR